MSVNKWKIKANALLDDPSIRTYLNSLNSIILAVLKGRLRALTVKRGPCNLVRLRKKYCRPTMINDTSVKFHMEKISLSKPSTCPIIQC